MLTTFSDSGFFTHPIFNFFLEPHAKRDSGSDTEYHSIFHNGYLLTGVREGMDLFPFREDFFFQELRFFSLFHACDKLNIPSFL